ncbi:hypothetical protein CWS02_19675 [Enterobacter sp. EA-1]|nr:hypothetical protein CWS02_19675 [Enterobacter sp. EA-1]
MLNTSQHIEYYEKYHLTNLLAMQELKDTLNNATKATFIMVFQDDADKQDVEEKVTVASISRIETLMAQQQTIQGAELQQMLEQVKQRQTEYVALVRQTVSMAKNGQMLDSQSMAVDKLQPAQASLFDDISAMIARQQASTTSAATATTRPDIRRSVVGLCSYCSAAGRGAPVCHRHIKRQLGGEPAYALRVVRDIAEGNLATRVTLAPGG